MSGHDDYWDYLRDEAESKMIEDGIKTRRDDQIAGFLGSYGDAVQSRIDRCVDDAKFLIGVGCHAAAVVRSVTGIELAIRYFIVKPILEGAFLSEEWSEILVKRIVTHQVSSDREFLPKFLGAWGIDIGSIRLASGESLWGEFKGHILKVRNQIVHTGADASPLDSAKTLECAEVFLHSVVGPLSDKFGFSWSVTRIWNRTQQGVGGAKSSSHFNSQSPFE